MDVSVVLPVYRCAPLLEELRDRLVAALEPVGSFELVFVEDGGDDGSWAVLERLAAADPRVRAFGLSRNFGQHAAITAGIEQARGEWVVVMDSDLQDPPEVVPQLLARARDGFDVVFARRVGRGGALRRRLASRLYARLMRTFTGRRIDPSYGSFSVIARPVADAYLRFRDRNRHYLYVLQWLGFRQTHIDYPYAERPGGGSSYTFRSLLRHAAAGVFFQTTALLRWVIYLGFGVSLLGGAAAVYFAVSELTGGALPGWTSLIVILLVLGGFIIVSTGITGLYIGEVFDQVRDRPLYVVAREAGAGAGETRE
jgi:dolichol-phosphate mannosyltransferase